MKRALWLALLLCACDESPKKVAHAKAAYQALIDQGALPSDPRFEPVLKELAEVKPNEAGYASAQKLSQAIAHARGPAVKAPLATGGTTGDADLDALKVKCAALASQVGPLEGAAREAKLREVEACKQEVIALDLKKEHELELWDGGK